ncbi:hypothetical protein OE88DRAFT_1359692 [Heliocybe sulcata]|uniref:Uncharacterized protein n=1 Tax=Heliocybe sulcata TaxID=5364 RepID=A0A5C3N5K7_9AGAM|nr:hypothetical protein OE88DRAFT_1359692 [Heliocybe sulcata]
MPKTSLILLDWYRKEVVNHSLPIHEDSSPPLAGQVRFRTTTSSDLATFASGRDLQLPDGRAWNISIFEIARWSMHSGLRAQLLLERLVTEEVLDTAANISTRYGARIVRPYAGSCFIWKFGQKFLVHFESSHMHIWVIGSLGAEMLHLQNLFSVRIRELDDSGRAKIVHYTPFAGRAVVQFEHLTVPLKMATKMAPRTVVLRIVTIIEFKRLERSDPYACWAPVPQEGGLVMTRMRHRWTPWSVDVDRPQRGLRSSWKALTLLFNNEALQAC